MTDKPPMPNTVKFQSQGVDCIAFEVVGIYGLNMRSCQLIFGETKPKVEIEPVLGFCRVRLNDGQIWFDTNGESAGAIAELFSK